MNIYRLSQVESSTSLIEQFLHFTKAYQTVGTIIQRFSAIEKTMPDEPQTIGKQCEDHLAISQSNEFFSDYKVLALITFSTRGENFSMNGKYFIE